MASALLVQKEVSSDEYTIKTRKNEGKNTVKTSVKMILERVALTGKTQKPDRKIETRKGYEEYFLCSPASMFLRGLSNLFWIFAHTFSARAIVITHIVSDWLFSPCCVEHQDEFIFERVAVAYSRDYNEVGRAQIKLFTMDDDGRTPEHEYPISSPMSLWLRWAKKVNISVLLVMKKKIFWCFYHIWAWRSSWSCDLEILKKLCLPNPRMLRMKPGYEWPCSFVCLI